MRVIPVIDLLGGQVVRGVGGRRSEYRPIVSSLASGSEPAEIALALRTKFDAELIYVADLDAIERRAPDCAAWRAMAGCGVRLMIDAGVGTVEAAAKVAEQLSICAQCSANGGEHAVVIGLESLQSVDELGKMVGLLGAERAIFSLDLRAGVPQVGESLSKWIAERWAATAVDAGFERMIVLDLADVGTSGGVRTLELCRSIHQRYPRVELIAGGGVRSAADLRMLEAAGCSAALVASALHDGRLTAADIEAVR